MASPFPAKPPKHEDDLITPAREGSLRVLRAARDAKARRLVFTSSFAAIGFGHADQERPFTEADWTDLKRRPVSAYVKSKTLAERAVWDFYARERRELEVCVINPVEVFGPLLGSNYATTILLVKRALEGALPGLPKMWLSTVDVRDVADLHLRAMTHPLAVGERFIASAGPPISLVDVAHLLRRRLGEKAKRVPTRELPNFLIRLAALKEPGLKLMIPELGRRKELSNEKACRIFGWQPRSHEEALVATAESLWRLGLLEPK
jgi:dihydroflavonol-4-reductase